MNKKTSNGFTLTELIIVLAIIGVFIGMATPSFINTINRNKVKNVIYGFEGALKAAKHTARTSGRQIDICPVDDITIAKPVCSNWDKFKSTDKEPTLGWVVFRDRNSNNAIDENEIIKKVPFNKSVESVMWSKENIITITPRGETYNNGTLCVYIPKQDTLDSCTSDTEISSKLYGAKVVISKLGAIRIERFYSKNK